MLMDEYEHFDQWLLENQFPKSNLIIHHFEETGRGLMTTEDVQEGQVLISIPKRFLLSTRSALDSDLGEVFKAEYSNLSALQILCLHLLNERKKKEQSFWWPYIRVLPKSFTTLLFFSKSNISALQNAQLIQDAKNDQLEVERSYLELKSSLFKKYRKEFERESEEEEDVGEHFSFSLFRWAWGVICTRSCFMDIDKSRNDNCVITPFADMINHSNVTTDARYNEETQCYEMTTQNKFKKGEQVFICYGTHSNSSLLRFYGFIIPSNPSDCVVIDLDWEHICPADRNREKEDGEESLHQDKLELLRELNLQSTSYMIYTGEVSWNLLTVLRIMMMSFQEFKLGLHSHALEDTWISKENEKRTWTYVVQLMETMLESYPSSLQEDEEWLKKNACGSNYSGSSSSASSSQTSSDCSLSSVFSSPTSIPSSGQMDLYNAVLFRFGIKSIMLSVWTLGCERLAQVDDSVEGEESEGNGCGRRKNRSAERKEKKLKRSKN